MPTQPTRCGEAGRRPGGYKQWRGAAARGGTSKTRILDSSNAEREAVREAQDPSSGRETPRGPRNSLWRSKSSTRRWTQEFIGYE